MSTRIPEGIKFLSEKVPEGIEGEFRTIEILLEHPPRYDCISEIDGKKIFNPFTGDEHNRAIYLGHREGWIDSIRRHLDSIRRYVDVLDDNPI